MALYSLLLLGVLVVGAPWWLSRMARVRAGLGQRLGRVPLALQEAAAGQRIVWIHAVSVGEVLAATRLVEEMERSLGTGWMVVVSTTTATGQALAQERFGTARVFYYPLDFAWAVCAYLKVLQPRLLVLMESELWPRMLVECGRAGVPVAVVNARVSDRSYARAIRVRAIWGRVLRRVDLFLAQSEEDARRLVAMGARPDAVRAIGNLKYDVRAPKASRMADLIKDAAARRPIVVAGSTVGRSSDTSLSEDEMVIQAWEGRLRREAGALLVIAPRHPERFGEVEPITIRFCSIKASDWVNATENHPRRAVSPRGDGAGGDRALAKSAEVGTAGSDSCVEGHFEIVLLDTIGDLAAVYGVADVAFVGGSLVGRGGHNPLEPAQFGVPVIMGRSFENFRDVVSRMQDADAISIVNGSKGLEAALLELLTDREAARAMGERGRRVFEQQQGATARAVETLVGLARRTCGSAR